METQGGDERLRVATHYQCAPTYIQKEHVTGKLVGKRPPQRDLESLSALGLGDQAGGQGWAFERHGEDPR